MQLLVPSHATSCILAPAVRKSQQVIGWCSYVGLLVRWPHPSGKGATKGQRDEAHSFRAQGAAVGPELKFRAGVEATAGELAAATTSGAGLAKKQSKVFDTGGEL